MTPTRNGGAQRLDSVDALRGLAVAAMLLVNNPGDWGHVYGPLRHAQWQGCTPTDLVFPFFLFVVGVSLALGVGDRLEGAAVRRAVLLRALRLLLLGLALHALAAGLLDRPALRLPGVLQRIGLCLALTASIAGHWRARGQWGWIAALLLGHGLLLGLGGMAPLSNPVSRLDAWLFGPHAYQWEAASGQGHDPEGVLSTLGALATTLLGWRCGVALRQGAPRRLIGLGLGLALGGAALHASGLMPFNKNLWSPSFALWAAGLAAWLLAGLHATIDRRGWPAPGRAFGVNALAAYAGAWIAAVLLEAAGLQRWLFEAARAGLGPNAPPELASLAFALTFVALFGLGVRALDRRRLYLTL